MQDDVVITGIGLRTPLGNTPDAVRAVFASGQSAVRRVEGPGGRVRVAALLEPGYGDAFTRVERTLLDPIAQLSVLSADDAIRDSGMVLDQLDRNRLGVFVGIGQGTAHTATEGCASLFHKDTVKPYTILRGLPNGVTNQISIRHGLRGEAQTLAGACAASNTAIGSAYRLIRAGVLDAALAGGSEATYCESVFRAWESMRVLATPDPDRPWTTYRPFSKDRGGIVLGEGAVLYMLESERHARARGARIYARMVGYGASSDATHIAQPNEMGQVAAMKACLRDAGLAPEDIGYVNAHGTGTLLGDLVEVQAIRNTFGAHADSLPVSSTKALHGHMLGATGAIELLASIFALNDGMIAPSANLFEPDPELGLDFVPNEARLGVDIKATMSNSFAFGGSNACILLTR